MSRIKDYSKVTKFANDHYMIVDGASSGTKAITVNNAAKDFGKRWSGSATFGDAFDTTFVDSQAVGDFKETIENDILDGVSAAFPTEEITAPMASTTVGANGIPMKVIANIAPVQEGSGDPAPDNVRPITGHTGLKILRAGSNFAKLSAGPTTVSGITATPNADGTVHLTGTATGNGGPRVTDSIYLIPGNYYVAGAYIAGLYYPRLDGDDGTRKYPSSGQVYTITKAQNYYIRQVVSEGATVDINVEPIIALEQNTVFEPSKMEITEIPFGEDAGTVYGGELDLLTGVLTINRASITFDGSSDENWIASGSTYNVFIYGNDPRPLPAYINAADIANEKYRPITNCVNVSKYNFNEMRAHYPCMAINDYSRPVLAISADITTAEQATAWLAENNVQLVYRLAEPITVQLTPQRIKSLLGVNYVYTDCGDVTVEFPADPNLYIDKRLAASKSIIAGVESAMMATKTYSVGDMLIVGDDLYKVTSAITPNETITVGSNVIKTTVAEQLIALANA